MTSKEYSWHKASESEIELPENRIAVVEVDGKTICITKIHEEWFAFAHSCPHAGSPLSEGYLDGKGNIICPVHNYKFNIRNGRIANLEGYYLKTYPVESRSDGIYIGFKKEGSPGWL